ncbi:hypothetical protein B5X24_HaOG207524 [Helicoverpa armigera]|nr:hypothetical protein B5X24_HaOG207524 [Helicoverpa armigera]
MSKTRLLILLCLVLNSYEKSTPQDDHYVGAVVEYLVTGNVATNLVNYANLIKEAADQGADIVVFPEDTLTNSSTYFTVPIYGALKNYPIPALYPTMFDEFMVDISTAARANQIYVVINGREMMDCTIQNTGENCPEEKSYMFKTNVVFDRTGAVIDRFRKINLFRQESYTPALKPDLGVFTTDFGFMVAISTAARANQIYVVINGRELMDCTIKNTGENCPEEKSYMFKTNVVFDRTGAVIDRFRKINLFRQESYTPALKPDLGVFTTDFGVTFGHFICFDLMFQIPAVQVVQKMNIKDVIFPTMWFSELPYLTAVQIQEAYAYALDVNFLGSGANNVRVGSGGSGIYSGKAGALISIMPGLPTTKVLVAKVPKVPGEVSWPYPGPIYDEPFNMNNMRLIVDPSLASHVTKLLEPGTQEFTLVDKDVSCTFRVTLSQRNSQISVRYRAFVQDGTNTYARREVGVVACLLVACKDDNVTSCSYRYTQQEENEIEKLEIEMNTYRNTYNDTLDCNNIEYFPVTYYRYRAGVFSGVRSYSGVATGGVRICGVYACSGDARDTCGSRFATYLVDTTAIFDELTITATMPTPSLEADLDTNDSIVYPVSSTIYIMPLESEEYSYTVTPNNDVTVHTMSLKNKSAELYAFAIWGRRFATDGQVEDPPLPDDETTTESTSEVTAQSSEATTVSTSEATTTTEATADASVVHLLSHTLLVMAVTVICYSQF